MGQHIIAKVQRWAVFLSWLDNKTAHIPGDEKVFADIPTRWKRGYRRKWLHIARLCGLVHTAAYISSPTAKIGWPNIEEFRRVKANHRRPPQLKEGPDGLLYDDNVIWIPANATQFKLKILILFHSGSIVQRGKDGTESKIRETFTYSGRSRNAPAFVKNCLQCIATRSRETVPRPLGTAQHGFRPN